MDLNSTIKVINRFKSKRPLSLLAFNMEGQQIRGAVAHRQNGQVLLDHPIHFDLTVDPLNQDAELVGQEIRNRLNEAGIREKHCLVTLPLQWALTLQTELPDMPAEHEPDFLKLQAEKRFPYPAEDLAITYSRYEVAGKRYATLIAIPKNLVTRVENGLKAAQLKPVSFSLGAAALADLVPDPTAGTLVLTVHDRTVDLLVLLGQQIMILRSLEGVFETQGNETRMVNPDVVAREIRITLGQLPAPLRGIIKHARLFGSTELAKPMLEELAPILNALGLHSDTAAVGLPSNAVGNYDGKGPGIQVLRLAIRHLAGVDPVLEFLPPQLSPWLKLVNRFSSRKLVSVGGSALAVLALFGAVFLWQYVRLSMLQSKWRAIEPDNRMVDATQQKIRKFRPWFDESFQGLTILKQITESFPQEGSVSVKSLEIKGLSVVTCSGVARDNTSLIKTLDQLRTQKQIADLKIVMVRGKSPLQYSFQFRWEGGAAQ